MIVSLFYVSFPLKTKKGCDDETYSVEYPDVGLISTSPFECSRALSKATL
jgi:hypothetical protein